MHKTIIRYNENEIVEGKGSKEDTRQGYNLWIDVIGPTSLDISRLQKTFNLTIRLLKR